MAIIFVKPRFFYESFTDFWSLVRLSGFNWCWMDEINLKTNNAYIVTSVDFKRDKWRLTWWQKRKKQARVIFWDIERPHPRGGKEKAKGLLHKQNFDEIWCSDVQLARDIGARYVVLGSDEKLGARGSWYKKYDLAHMSYENGRRGAIFEQLKNVGPNGWGNKRRDILKHSKFGLSVHQDNDLYCEPLRLALFASYGLPTISESVYDPFPLADCLLSARYDDIINFCNSCITNYKVLKDLGTLLKQTLCFDYRFVNMVEYAVKN